MKVHLKIDWSMLEIHSGNVFMTSDEDEIENDILIGTVKKIR